MLRRLVLYVALAVLLVACSVLAVPVSAFAECAPDVHQTTGCPTEVTTGIGDGQVTIGGTVTSPGGGNGGGGDTAGGSEGRTECIRVYQDRCQGFVDKNGQPLPPVTLSDIAHFRPSPGVDHMEPNGWMIVGLDTNFYATGGAEVVDGVLLGQPASVRFTPVAWHWAYGDGETASRGTPGGTWAAQAIPEFDPTATSHIYSAPGTYTITLSIDFAAEYRFGPGPWANIAGTLSLSANPLEATAGDAKTVLVERECTANPSGPGC